MANKKEDKVTGQSIEPVISTLKERPVKEKLLRLRATAAFSDGNLMDFFKQYGYEVEWKVDEVREIPAWLMQRCVQSGAELERADG